MKIDFANLAIQIAITIAIVNYIKALSKDKLGFYSILVAIGVGFILTILGILPAQIDWLFVIKNTFTIGLAAAGIYKVADKIGGS